MFAIKRAKSQARLILILLTVASLGFQIDQFEPSLILKEATATFFCRALFMVRGTIFEQIPPKLVEVTHFQNEKKIQI